MRLVGSSVMAMKVYVTYEKLANVFQAIPSSMPNIADVISHPLYAWKKSIEFSLVEKCGGLRFPLMSCHIQNQPISKSNIARGSDILRE